MTNAEAEILMRGFDGLRNLEGNAYTPSLAYATGKMASKLRPAMDGLAEARRRKGDAKLYDDKRMALAESLAIKKEDGTPRTSTDGRFMFESPADFQVKFEKFRAENPGLVQANDAWEEGLREVMKKEAIPDCDIYKVKFRQMLDIRDAGVVQDMSLMIEEPTEEDVKIMDDRTAEAAKKLAEAQLEQIRQEWRAELQELRRKIEHVEKDEEEAEAPAAPAAPAKELPNLKIPKRK